VLKEDFDKFIVDNGFKEEGEGFFFKDFYTGNGVFTFYINWCSDECKPYTNEGTLETIEDLYYELIRQIDDLGLIPLRAITTAKDTIARFNRLREELYSKWKESLDAQK
jgi:hypothetical protein